MNAIVIQHPTVREMEIRSFASLAHTQSRLSVQYGNWSREAILAGQSATAARWAAESARLRRDAIFHIDQAWQRKGVRIARA